MAASLGKYLSAGKNLKKNMPNKQNNMIKPGVYMYSLGCSKNLVDSQLMCGVLKKEQFLLVDNPADAEVIVVNTCGFIEAAKKETIDAILELAQYKEQGKCRLLLAVGCMVQKYADDMAEAMPEIDALMGVGSYQDIGSLISSRLGLKEDIALPIQPNIYLERDFSVLDETAYLKIAEGCDNCCSFCLIPQLRGAYHSRPIEDILAEAEILLHSGVKEIVLLAQDTTYYGQDLYGKPCLAELLDKLSALPFMMIRLLYAYPDGIDQRLIEVMAGAENICHYLDMPVQHGVDHILQAMNRPDTRQSILQTIERLRQAMPDIALRTTLMVGFPGETDEDFQGLLDFMEQARFDWVGAFPYYQEEDTTAAEMDNQLSAAVKQERLDQLMLHAAHLTEAKLGGYLGRELTVLVKDNAYDIYGEGWLAGRSQYQAPEVDGMIYFHSDTANIGDIIRVKITRHEIYDLIGEQI